MFWILVAVLLVTLFYYFCYKPSIYWRERGVKQTDFPNVLIDNYFGIFTQRPLVQFISDLYNRFPGTRYNGLYQFNRPALIVTDVDLIKQMLIKDFEHFNEHRDFASEEVDPLWSKNLFSLKGNKWRNMRSTLSPSFTSSKMKGMLYLITNVADKFTKHFLNQDKDLIEVEMKELASRYGTDVIASTAFGLEVDSLANPNNEFFLKGKEFLDLRNIKVMARFIVAMFLPKIAKLFNIKFLVPSIEKFFTKIIKDTIKLREEKGLVRPDMIHLLLEARKGNIHSEDQNIVDAGYAIVEEHLKADKTAEITDDDIIAQAFVFFFAGFDSSSTLISFLAYELCANQDIQEKLRDEVKDTLDSCNGKLTYEALVNMKYMDMVVTGKIKYFIFKFSISYFQSILHR
uniref:Cytochrome P450 9e2-like n=1 Tax=Diabrotica virgifera virgifera TaxID=50390 RepID=A0A6P7FLQ7_DIAVI